MANASKPRAFLFDLDGTLIDSMPHHEAAWIEWHRRHGLPFDDAHFFSRTAGRANIEILSEMLPQQSTAEHVAMGDEKEAFYREIAAQALTLIAGAQRFVEDARAAGLRLAVCTASTLPNMALAFARFPIDQWVETIVSPADGLRGKPHPDIFLEAARRLNVPAAQCVVFEDAPLGIEGARRAGMKAVALTTGLPATAFAGFDNLLASASDFSSLSVAALTKEDHHA